MTYLTRDQQHQITCDQVLNLPRLDRQFYSARALDVAPRLLGMVLARVTSEGVTAGRIIETEAYEAPEDRACHAFGGRRTRRTEVMYGPPGHAYVYFTYGMHWMLNVVAAAEGTPHAVLIRSIEPICGLSLMAKRRRGMLPLAEGPARLCQALGITRADNGVDLVGMPGMAKMARIAGMPGTAGTPGIAGMPRPPSSRAAAGHDRSIARIPGHEACRSWQLRRRKALSVAVCGQRHRSGEDESRVPCRILR